MAFHIKQENYSRPPTAEQRKVLRFLQVGIPSTRIDAHLAIRALLYPTSESTAEQRVACRNRKRQMDEWRKTRKLDRDHRRALREDQVRAVRRILESGGDNARSS